MDEAMAKANLFGKEYEQSESKAQMEIFSLKNEYQVMD
jgi:hypothetical protein